MKQEERKSIEKFRRRLSFKEIDELNKKQLEETKKQFSAFAINFKKNKCYICGLPLDKFDIKKPCAHWLLRPNGLKKKNLREVFKLFDYANIDSYIRWVANQEKIAGNINDLTPEEKSDKLIETTIKYKNIEWSISCSKNDLEGHKERKINFPHYHLQIKIDNKPFVNYSDFHVPLTEHDLFTIAVKNNEFKNIKHVDYFGSGMEAVFKTFNPKELLDILKKTDDVKNAPFNVSYIIQSKDSKPMPSKKVEDLLKKYKNSDKTFATILKNHKDLSYKAIISEGEGVPEKAIRKKKKR